MKTEFCECINSVDIISLYASGVYLYKRFYTVEKNFEENMQEQEIDRDLFKGGPI